MTRLRPLAAALALAVALAAPARALDVAAREALVIDATTGAELLSINADERVPPASMLKLMTLYMVFEALEEGRLTLDDRFPVSEKAWRMGGSRMFVEVGEQVRIEDLIRGITVLSGNDAAVVLAEGLAGSEEAFAARMNDRARELGMDDSRFANATGWPAPDQHMSARDLVFLAREMIVRFPDLYRYFAETDFEWGGVAQRNRNPLLYADVGGDGLKTGHTQEAGYGLVGSAVRDGRRVVFMVGGYDSERTRARETALIVNWAFREFENVTLYRAGDRLAEAEVWLGARPKVALTLAEDVLLTIPFGTREQVTATLRWTGPLEAPIAAGAQVGELALAPPGMAETVVPVVTAESVGEGGYLVRLETAARGVARDLLGGTGLLERLGLGG